MAAKTDFVDGQVLTAEQLNALGTEINTNAAAVTAEETRATAAEALKANTADVGDKANLTTTEKGSLVGAINELNAKPSVSDAGDVTFDRDEQYDDGTVGAALETNENDISTVSGKIGNLSDLTTTAQNNVVAAVNEVKASTTDLEQEVGSISSGKASDTDEYITIQTDDDTEIVKIKAAKKFAEMDEFTLADDNDVEFAKINSKGVFANAFYDLDGNSNNHWNFRARIVEDSYTYSDDYGSQPTYTFNALQVLRKYNESYDLLMEFGFNGANGFYQPLKWALIANKENNLSAFPDSPTWTMCSEIIGPWYVQAVNSATISGMNYVGGFHGFIVDANGKFYNETGYDSSTGHKYPSASCDSYKIYADGIEMNVGDSRYTNEIRVVSNNYIQGYNTWVFDDKAGRNVLSLQETWMLKGEKIYVLQDINALEDCEIHLHYGIQTVSFNPYIRRASANGIITFDSSTYEQGTTPTERDYGKDVYALIAEKANGDKMITHMDKKGIFNGAYSGSNDAFDRCYGKSSAKQYWNVVETSAPYSMASGDRTFYSGWVMYTDKLPLPCEF